jgi:hypothetical protein
VNEQRTVGLTALGRAYVALTQVRDRWDSLDPAEQAQALALLGALNIVLRSEHATLTPPPRRGVKLVGRIVA